MNELKLNSLLNTYVNLQKREEDIKLEKEALKSAILEEMGDQTKYDNGYLSASVVLKETFKYTDETAIINYLKTNGYGTYVKEKIDTTSFNKVLKSNPTTMDTIKSFYTKSLTEALSVKASKE